MKAITFRTIMGRASFAGILSAMAAFCAPASAVPILTFGPATQSVSLGSTADVDVMVTGLTGEYVGTYDFNVNWDPLLLGLQGLSFGIALDGPADSLRDFTSGSGSANVWEVSLGGLLNQNGSADFRLFTLSFSTIAAGTSALTFTGNILPQGFLGDELGEILPGEVASGSMVINAATSLPTSASEPGTLGLLGLGFAGTLAMRRRPRHAAR